MEREFKDKMDDQRIKQKIEVSQKTNQTRLDKMKRRNECMENLKTSARWRLQNEFNKDNPQYVETLKSLIIQVRTFTISREIFEMLTTFHFCRV